MTPPRNVRSMDNWAAAWTDRLWPVAGIDAIRLNGR